MGLLSSSASSLILLIDHPPPLSHSPFSLSFTYSCPYIPSLHPPVLSFSFLSVLHLFLSLHSLLASSSPLILLSLCPSLIPVLILPPCILQSSHSHFSLSFTYSCPYIPSHFSSRCLLLVPSPSASPPPLLLLSS